MPPDVPKEVLTPEQLLVAPCDKLYGVPLDQALSDDTILIGALLPRTGLLSLLGVAGTLVSDLLLLWLDPRIRLGGGTR